MSTKSKIESILFASTKPLSPKQLENIIKCDKNEIKAALEELANEYNQKGKGINLINNKSKYQFATSPDNSKIIQEMLKSEMTGELTRPSLETLTVVAYRGPITKAELEQIRGVNCSLILRNLLMRGLVEASYDKKRAVTLYNITLDFMRYLGISDVKDLPEYEKLNANEDLAKLLEASREKDGEVNK
jgi:segregation and condensation protein B